LYVDLYSLMRKFIVGPPGTGKTTRLVELYYGLIQQYNMESIITISHTNVAADEIRDRIRNEKNAKKYKVWDKIKANNKKFYEEHISTIHSYCKSKLFGAQVFDEECYLELDRQNKLFSRHYHGGKDLKALSKKHPFWKFLGFATDNDLRFSEYWKKLSDHDRKEYKYTLPQLISLDDYYQKFKKDYKLNKKSSNVVDFIDMIDQFNKAPKDPEIKVLIVDEAQDSSAPQRKALDKMEKKAEVVYWAGDPDQSIYGFAGADPDYFSRISAQPDCEELKQGHRCPRIINEYCKQVIAPIWQHYGYTRTWKPREDKKTGKVIEGEKHPLENLERCPKLPLLIDRLHNTDETFIFTYRGGNECLDRILNFLKKEGIRYSSYGTENKFVKDWEINCHRNFPDFTAGKPLDLKLIKDICKKGNSLLLEPGYQKFDFKDFQKRDYTLQELINKGVFTPKTSQYKKYEQVKHRESRTSDLENFKRTEYINKIIKKNIDLKKDVRVFYDNIHSIKGTEFDNVIFDESLIRPEPRFDRLRLRYVGCSRAKKTLWLLKTITGETL